MEWSKLKNIIILMLAAVNVMLLVLVLSRQWESRSYSENAREDAVAILWETGRIRVERDALPDEMDLPVLTVTRDPELELRQAEALLGALSGEPSSMRYEGERGTAQFYANGGFSAELEAGACPIGDKAPAAYAVDLLAGMEFEAQVLEVIAPEGHLVHRHLPVIGDGIGPGVVGPHIVLVPHCRQSHSSWNPPSYLLASRRNMRSSPSASTVPPPRSAGRITVTLPLLRPVCSTAGRRLRPTCSASQAAPEGLPPPAGLSPPSPGSAGAAAPPPVSNRRKRPPAAPACSAASRTPAGGGPSSLPAARRTTVSVSVRPGSRASAPLPSSISTRAPRPAVSAGASAPAADGEAPSTPGAAGSGSTPSSAVHSSLFSSRTTAGLMSSSAVSSDGSSSSSPASRASI